MKALLMKEYRKLGYVDVPTPAVSDDHDVLLRVRAAAICGSDVHGYDGSTGRRIPPVIMGHEGSGEVVSCGKTVSGFSPGDRVTFDSTIYCMRCQHCRAGRVNLCDNRRVLGVSCDEYNRQGIFAEYVLVPDHILYRLPDALSFEEAALTEPAAVAAHAVRRTPLEIDDTIAVIGTGVIGLMVIMLLRASSSGRIIACDTDASRHEAARQAGADLVLDPRDPQMKDSLSALTGGKAPDRVFEAVGTSSAIATAIDLARKGGSVTLIGNVSPVTEFALQKVVTREISLFGSCAIAGEYPVVLDMMARKVMDVRPLISAQVPLSEGPQWFERLYAREQGLLKVVLTP